MTALYKIEGFDWIDHFSYVYTTSGSPVTSDSNTRFSAGRLAELTTGDQIQIPIGSQLDSGTVGFAWYNTSVGTNAQDICLLYGPQDGGQGGANMKIRLAADSVLHIVDAAGTSLGNSSSNTVSSNTWYYIELAWEIANSTAEYCTLKVDGINWIEITSSSDTLNSPPVTQGVDRYVLVAHTDGTTRFDDFYCGTRHSGLFGDMQIVSLVPTGDIDGGNTWTNSVGNQTNNYAYVDETGNPDDDTTYVYTTGDEKLEMYRFGNLGVTANEIYGIELITRAKKSGAGDMYIGQNFLTDSATSEPSDSVTQLGASYAYIRTVIEDNPDTSTLFTDTEVNNLHFGSKSYTGLASAGT